jgi:hypothetical protein
MASSEKNVVASSISDLSQDSLRQRGPVQAKKRWWQFGTDRSFVLVDDNWSGSSSLKSDEEYSKKNDLSGTVFSDPSAAAIYKPVDGYEGNHRIDPTATWTDQEEKKLIRRVGAQAFSIY